VSAGRVDRVLNLAAGLDARPWRLPLPAGFTWVDVDLPAILAHKREGLAAETPRCRYEAVTLDLREAPARRRLFAERCGAGTRTLVVTEGLLVYLAPEEVAALADDLAVAPGARSWLMDLASPALLRLLARQWGSQLARGGAPFQFGPAEGTRFFEPHGWREVEYRSMWDEARRLRRQMAFAWLWRFLGGFAPRARREEWRRFSGIVLLERTSATAA
jgi:methyltransferase (TIGR00027 family)